MAKYTTEVRSICEAYAGMRESGDRTSVDDTITSAIPMIFGDFPIFDEAYREPLERKILYHFYTREIGYETVGLWKLKLNNRLNELMPYYNQLYESTLIEFNPLYTHELHTKKDNTRTDNRGKSDNNTKTFMKDTTDTETRNMNDTNTQTRNTTDTLTKVDTHYDLTSDTPQGGLTGLDELTYMSEAQKHTLNDTDTTRGTGTVTDALVRTGTDTNARTERGTIGDAREIEENAKTVDDYTDYVYGYSGTNLNKLLKDFRENMLNIDMMLINDLNKLFMGLW